MKRLTNQEIINALGDINACSESLTRVYEIKKGGSEPWRQFKSGNDMLWLCLRLGLWKKVKPAIMKSLDPAYKEDNDDEIHNIEDPDSHWLPQEQAYDFLYSTKGHKNLAKRIRKQVPWKVIQKALLKEAKG